MRRVLLAQTELELGCGMAEKGGLLMDAPAFGSVEELLLLAEDREAWRREVRELLGEADPARSAKAESDGGKRSKKRCCGHWVTNSTSDTGHRLVVGSLREGVGSPMADHQKQNK